MLKSSRTRTVRSTLEKLRISTRAAQAARPFICLAFIAFAALGASAAENVQAFAPALSADMIDLPQCRQYVNGKPAKAEPEQVERALGFLPGEGTWQKNIWEISGAADGGEAVYHFLVVFKRPVEAGTLVCSPAEGFRPTQGSINGGELHYLKDEVKEIPDPANLAAWTKAQFAFPAQHLRFATLPPGTRIKALLYKDVRMRGTAQLPYLSAFKNRLQDLTFAAAGSCDAGEPASDPDNVPLGKSWHVWRKDEITPKTPVRYTLMWDAKRKLDGIFLFSNARQFRIFSINPQAGNPILAPDESWDPVAYKNIWDYPEALPSWHWLEFPAIETSALRIEVSSVIWSKDCWIQGFAAFTALGDKPLLALKPLQATPPFRFAATLPSSGDAALVVDDAKGHRVQNVFAQTFRSAEQADESWNLRDLTGEYVSPGEYSWKGIVGPQLELLYGVTPYPNLQNFFPERMPWMVGHTGVHGWLADHGPNYACATTGDRVYFGATLAEAGVSMIECDLEGRRQWAQHSFGGWIGVYRMAADAEKLFVLDSSNEVHCIDAAARKDIFQFRPYQGPHRRGWISGIAAREGKVYVAYSGGAVFANSALTDDLDFSNCRPTPPDRQLARLLRIEGSPPGFAGAGSHQPGFAVSPTSDKPQGNGRLYLESDQLGQLLAQRKEEARPKKAEPDKDDLLIEVGDLEDDTLIELDPVDVGPWVSVIAFRKPVALGSVVFPWPESSKGKLQFAVLKPDASYPPRPEEENDWIPFEHSGGPGWNCVPAPPRTMTQGLRVTFEAAREDEPFWRLEGLRLLNRRFANLFPSATVRVNSGEVSSTGEWDARRTAPVWPDKPGVYVMEWKQVQKLCGLAIKEIDGAVAEIDVWQGPAPDKVPLEGPALDRRTEETGWRNLATYKQERRNGGYSHSNNRYAWYIDGYVDFGEVVETRAVRIRIIEQWLDNGHQGTSYVRRHDGRSEHGMHFTQSYCVGLDTRFCKVMGVAPLSPLGGDVPGDPLIYQRLEVWDAKTGKFVKELPSRIGWDGLSFAPDGTLYATDAPHKNVCRVDLKTGELTPVIRDVSPGTFTIGPDGLFYVHSYAESSTLPVAVYDVQGRKLREIGKLGGFQHGLWDPQRFGRVRSMCVDNAKNLWVLEEQDNPRRIVQYKTDGTFVKELLGNTHYGGHGTLDRTNRSRAFHDGVEFEIDWEKHTSRIRAYYGNDYIGGEPDVRQINGRTYLVSAPITLFTRQPIATVHLYDEQKGTVRLVAAMGEAAHFGALRRSDVMALLPPGDAPNAYGFLWFDRNGNQKVDVAEVDFKRKEQYASIGHFDDRLGCFGYNVYYEAAEFLPDGVPAYRRMPAPGCPVLRLNNGNYLTLAHYGPGLNFVCTPDGQKIWSYPASGGVAGLYVPPWVPGDVQLQLSLVGHSTAHAGELGEFFVVNDNTGQWRIWTADGLLAGNIFYHQADPRGRLFGPPDVKFGDRMDTLTAKQEHFHGFFTRTDPDNRYYAVAGFTHMSLMEVKGIEKFRRATGKFKVNAQDIARVQRWEAERSKRRTGGESAVLFARDCHGIPPEIDGVLSPAEWPQGTPLPGNPRVSIRLRYDSKFLYIGWAGRGAGPIANGGDDFRRIFKTGACLDLQIGTNEDANLKRTAPVAGDQRLLVTFVDGKPLVVLYQPVAPGAAEKDGWSTKTESAGTTSFARVAVVKDAHVAKTGDKDFVVEAAIPLGVLGLRPRNGLRLRGDWGILVSEDGHLVKTRMYWSNLAATGTADEAMEARFEPNHWGNIWFEGDPDSAMRRPDLIEDDDDQPDPSARIRGDILNELRQR